MPALTNKLRNRDSVDMCSGPLLGKIISYAVTIMLTGVLQLLFNAADLVVVGRYCGSLSVAAVGATNAISSLIVNFFIGLSVGAGVSVAVSIGAGDHRSTHDVVHTAIPSAAVCGLFMTLVGVIGCRQFLVWMGTPDDVLPLSVTYLRIYFCGMVPSMIYNYGAAILRAAGDTRRPLIFLSVAGVLNVILNVFFVVAFDLDVAGVALATSISQAVSATLVLVALTRRKDACRLTLKEMRIRKAPLKKIIRIGLPAGIQSIMFSVSNVLIQSSINSFGSIAISGNSAAFSIEGFVYIAMNAFHQAGMNFTGQNFGAKLYARIQRIRWICLGCVTATGIILGWGIYFFARPLLSVYISDSPEAIEFGVLRMSYICIPYFLNGLHDVMTGIIRGMGSSTAPMLISIFGICVTRIIWINTIFRLAQYHTLGCLYLSYPISWILTFVMQTICFTVLFRRLKKKNDEQAPLSRS